MRCKVWFIGFSALALASSGCSNDDGVAETEPEPVPAEPETPAEPAAEPEPAPVEPAMPAEPETPSEPDAPTVEPEPSVADASAPEPDPSSSDSGEPEPSPEELDGVCGQRGEGTVDADAFEGFEERYIIGDEGFGDEVCIVRFPVERVGDPPPGCIDLNGDPCAWAHEVEIGAGSVLTDDSGACAASDLALDSESIAAVAGSRVSYGFVEEYVGHNSVLLVYDEESQSWLPSGNANWDEATGSFRFDRRDGICSYQGLP